MSGVMLVVRADQMFPPPLTSSFLIFTGLLLMDFFLLRTKEVAKHFGLKHLKDFCREIHCINWHQLATRNYHVDFVRGRKGKRQKYSFKGNVSWPIA